MSALADILAQHGQVWDYDTDWCAHHAGGTA